MIFISENKTTSEKNIQRMNSETRIDTDLETHWDLVYSRCAQEKLGWYESDLRPTLALIANTEISKEDRILIAGAGCTTLVDHFLSQGFKNVIATDISSVALNKLESRVNREIEVIEDDLTQPLKLNNIAPVSLWIDRAVLHFFTRKNDQNSYFDLLNRKVITNGYVLLAEYNLHGATTCSGLAVHRYDAKMLGEKLGDNFKLVRFFDYPFIAPSGAVRPFIYTLFKKIHG
jgi:hypothetical protein